MRRCACFLWLFLVVLAGVYLSARIVHGLHFRTDLMALLPREEQNPDLTRSNDLVTTALSQHVVFLLGHRNKASAYAAAMDLAHRFTETGLMNGLTDTIDKDAIRAMGTFYFPHRLGLLSSDDRALLKAGQGQVIAERALSEVFGLIGLADRHLLKSDPFLLMPAFFTALPIPLSRLAPEDGLLSMQENGVTWFLVGGQLQGSPFDLDIQKKVTALYDDVLHEEDIHYPGLEVLHLGAVFFARAGAEEAMRETSNIGLLSTLGIIILMLVVFRAIRPLFLSLLVIGTGILTALSTCLLVFGELHVGALLFGVSLIGVTVDYSLQYCSEIFLNPPGTPTERLKRVWSGITLGTATTVIGYLTLYLAPFPGLHQIAAFSATGLAGSWLTVVLWLPSLDKKEVPRHASERIALAQAFLSIWDDPHYRMVRRSLGGLLAVLALMGFWCFHTDDNVRHMQPLSDSLAVEQEKIQALIGATTGNQFFVVNAENDEDALQKEEHLADRLQPLVASGELAGFQSPAQYIPSRLRQAENRTLELSRLYKPLLSRQSVRLNLAKAPTMPEDTAPFLTPADMTHLAKPPAFLKNLLLDGRDGNVTHIVLLDAVRHPDIIAAAASGIEGIRLVDPAGDFSHLLGKYRNRSLALLILSVLLMAPLLVGRYGFSGGLKALIPSLAAVLLTPALLSLMGFSFTFFDAIALVLILSVGVDYTVFFMETSEMRKPVTMIAVTMAACTALLSFGLLALSRVMAVQHFGATMTLGILLSFLFAPLSGRLIKSRSVPLFLAVVMSSLLLSGCAISPPPLPRAPEETRLTGPILIAPDVRLRMPKPYDLPRPVEAVQLVTASHGDETFAFEAHIHATPDHFLLVGLDMMGRKLMTIDWAGDKVSFEAAPWMPPELRPENILADLVLLYWPEAIVRQSLIMPSARFAVTAHRRTIMEHDQALWEADYTATKKSNMWNASIHYQNNAFGYSFDIKSAEIRP